MSLNATFFQCGKKKAAEPTQNDVAKEPNETPKEPHESNNVVAKTAEDSESGSYSDSESTGSDEENFNKPEYDKDLESSGSDNEDFWEDDDGLLTLQY
jgi:hypothetical protein